MTAGLAALFERFSIAAPHAWRELHGDGRWRPSTDYLSSSKSVSVLDTARRSRRHSLAGRLCLAVFGAEEGSSEE